MGLSLVNQMYIAMGINMAGSVVSAYGQDRQSKAEAAAMEFDAKVADDNAKNAEYAAKDAKKRGAKEERKHRQRVKLLVGKQKAAYGASGVDVTSGAPADVMAETVLYGTDDAATIRYNAAMEAWGMKARAANYRAQGGQYRVGAKGAKMSGAFAVGSTLLTGLGSTARQYTDYRYNQPTNKGGTPKEKSPRGPWG